MSTASPGTSPTDRDETFAIARTLAARRRRSLASVLRDFRFQRQELQKQRPGSSSARVEEETGEEDMSEGEGEDEPARVDTIDFEAFKKAVGDPVKIKGEDGMLVDPEAIGDEMEPEYVWDVLFENQRGTYLLGTAYYSSKTLLPSDPSPFTRPSGSVPTASSLSLKGSPDSPARTMSQRSRPKSHKGQKPSQSNKTSYTLDTFQPPLPDWEYLTPWLINMREGTDEQGWRYNACFRKQGWKSHAGNMGWMGWARRREWVRLRRVREKVEGASVREVSDLALQARRKEKKLGEVLSGSKEQNVSNILKVFGGLPLDRERLELWQKWLEKTRKGGETWTKMEAICQDEEAVCSSSFR
ncbi:hypothetical protein IAR50_002015 [Cryptococcus sp. DSM 104548]